MGTEDKASVNDYLENVREIERRLAKAEAASANQTSSGPRSPVGIPENPSTITSICCSTYGRTRLPGQHHAHLLLHDGPRGQHPAPIRHIGVPDAFHPTSHHQNDPQHMEMLVKINTYHMEILARFLTKLKAMPDGDGNMLDNSMILFGSGMSNSNMHNHFPLPLTLVGGACGRVKGNQHLRYADHTPVANLLLAILDRAGVPTEKIGDSTAEPVAL